MKKKRILNLVMFWCLFIFIFSTISCDMLSNGKAEDEETGIDYESYSDYALIVKNNAQKNMVLFKGEPSANQLLGGVRAGSTTKLKNNTSIFSESTDYVVYVVTEENYNAHKDNLSALNNSPYCTFYAVYNKGMVNTNTYQISNILGGIYSITINNGTNYNVELRNKSESGETIGFILANTYEQKIYLPADKYVIFPVFRKYDKRSGEILSAYPTYKSGDLAGERKSFDITLNEVRPAGQFNVKNWIDGVKFVPKATYIRIKNSADQDMQFFISENSSPYKTSAGIDCINAGFSSIFAINVEQVGDDKYFESDDFAAFRVGTSRLPNNYLNGDKSTLVTYKAGYLYSYTVTGDPEIGYTVTPRTEEIKQEDGTIVKVLKAEPYDWSTLD